MDEILELDGLTYKILKSGRATDPQTIQDLARQKIRRYHELQAKCLKKAEKMRVDATAARTYGTPEYYTEIHRIVEFAVRCEQLYTEYLKLFEMQIIEKIIDGKRATAFYSRRKR